jgi:hypothetical protein
MAGTGLPIPQSGVLAQSPGVMDGDRLTSAQAWSSIARSGAQLGDIAQNMMQTQRAAYFADQEMAARRKRVELQTQFATDPAGFNNAWQGYVSGAVQQVDPAARETMMRIWNGEGTTAYTSLLMEKENRDRRLAGDSLTARLTAAGEDVLGLAASGRIGTPEFSKAVETYDGIGATMANGGFISSDGFSVDKASLLGKAAGESILYSANGLYDTKGYEAALAETDALLKDPRSGLSPAEQRNYFGKVRSTLAVREAGRREDLKEVRAIAEPTVKLLREGVDGIEGDAERLAQRFEQLGSASDAASVRNAIEFNRGFRGSLSLPTREWGGAGFLDKMTAAESGGDATAANPRSSAFGAHQFIADTWLGVVQQYRPDLLRGRSTEEVLALRGDAKLSREMAGYHAQENASALRAANIPVTDGTQYLAWFAGTGGATALWRADPQASAESVLGAGVVKANPFLAKMSAGDVIAWADRKMQRAAESSVDPALLAGRRAGAEKVFDEWLPKAKVQFARWGVGAQDVSFVQGIVPYLDERRRGDLGDLLTSAELSTAMNQMAPDERAALMGALEQKAAGGDPAARQFLTEAEGVRKDILERERTDPLGRARDAGWLTGPGNIDWQQGGVALTESLTARARDAAVTAERVGQPVVAALRDDEARGLASRLTTGDGQQAMGLLMSLQQNLSPEQFGATLAMKPMQDALATMARGGEADRMTAAFSAYDALYRANPAAFEAQFGKAALDRLQTWQGKLQFESPDEIAKSTRRADDPSYQAARDKLRREGEKLVEKVTPGDVASKFGTWLSTPGASVDPIQNGAMAAEYQQLFVERYADTGDAETAEKQAMERLGNKWGVSALNGGRMTVRPPERYYPAVRGSHDWMRDQLESDLRQALGIPVAAGPSFRTNELDTYLPEGGAAPVPRYGLVADATTEADIAAGRPPSYAVWVSDRNGQLKVIESNGKARRFAWDREGAVEEGRAWFAGARRFMSNVREGQALDAELNGGPRLP